MSVPKRANVLDVPSQYEAFETNVIGASSPRALRRSVKNKRNSRSAKKQKVSDVAVAGESPILEDVASMNSSKASRSVNVNVNVNTCPQTSKIQVHRIDLGENSATPSLDDLLRNQQQPVMSTQVQPPNKIHEGTVDLLTTQSMQATQGEGYGQAKALRLPSSPESEFEFEEIGKKLPRKVQQERSLRRTLEWLDTLPNESSVDHIMENDNSVDSTVSINASQNDSVTSVLVLAPHPRIREVRIVLQRLDPQMLLKVPVHDIQNLFTSKPYSLSYPQIQKAVNSLITSAKIGLVPFQEKPSRQIGVPTATKQKTTDANGEGVSSSFLLRGKKPKKKRKLLSLERQPSNISEVIDVNSHHLTPVECPYSPPPRKTRKPTNKPFPLPKAKKTKPAVPKPRSKKDKATAPRKRETRKEAAQPVSENLRRTRSSDLFRKKNNCDLDQNEAPSSQDQDNISSQSSIQQGDTNTMEKPARRTSYFFQPKTQAPSQASKKRTPKRKKTFQIVGTFLHRGEMDMVLKAARKLGGNVQNKVTASTTHVVCGGPKRTINVLRGISRGCWLVKHDWVTQSVDKGHWIDEEPFELTNFSPAVQKCRIAKETLGIFSTIFKNVGNIYVSPRTTPPKAELCELIKLCGGKIVSTPNRAVISVGVMTPGCTSVTELWVLDSIQDNILFPTERYSLP